MKDVVYKVWGDRRLLLNADSFHSMWLMYNYIVDWEEFNLINHYVRSGNQVADVGANMGYYTIWMSKFVGSGTIHSFEPDLVNFQRLKRNCELNDLDNVKLNNVAVSDRSGAACFTRSLDGENHLSLDDQSGTIKINAVSFDDYCHLHNVSRLNYVKVDIEGFELFFLRGAGGLIHGKKIDIIQLEINTQLKNSGASVEEVLSYLQDAGYALCMFDTKLKKLREIDFEASRENYFAVADIESANKILSAYQP